MTFNFNISSIFHALGIGKDRAFKLSSFCFVIISFAYLFVIGSSLHTKMYAFQNRVTYGIIFDTHIATLNVDMLILFSATIVWLYLSFKNGYKKLATMLFFSIFLVLLFFNFGSIGGVGALLTLPFLSILIIIDIFWNNSILKHDVRISLIYLTIGAIVLAVLGIISLLHYITTGISTVTVEKYPYAVYQLLFSLLTPAIMAALVFCLPLKIISNEIISKFKIRDRFIFEISEVKVRTKWLALFLSMSIILGFGAASLPHLSVINPNNERLGVDSPRYVEWLNIMKNQTVDPIYFVLTGSGDRPLTLIILFFITEVTKVDSFEVVEYSPLFLTPLLVLVTFVLTRQLTNNDRISIIAAFLSAISFHTLIGIYSGFYANWLALILGYLAFTLIVRYLKSPSKISVVALALLMTGTLFTHVYTWSIMVSVAFVFLFVLHLLHYFPRKHFLVLYLILFTSIAVDITRSLLTGSSTGLEADVSLGFSHGFGVSQFNERLKTLAETVQTYYGGAYANIAILGLVMYWLVRCKVKEMVNIFVLIFLSSALVHLFLGDWVLQSRVLYNIPFQIPAAISLYAIWKEHHKIIFIAILLIASYLSFHVLANLGYVPPSSPLSLVE